MPKIFPVVSWNVEHFKNPSGKDPHRVTRVADFIAGNNGGPATVPDIFGVDEFEGKDVYQTFMDKFPNHRFHLTEGRHTQEIFIGVHRTPQTFSTQRLEFNEERNICDPAFF